MNESAIHFHPAGRLVALVGNPNCGKTALFNRLTGSRQKVANYAGVTVERKEGRCTTPAGMSVRVLDLPGAYSLYPRSPDERVTCDILFGHAKAERRPDLVVCVADATNLRRSLRLVLAVKRLGLPCVVALNMTDLAEKRGLRLDPAALARELDLPVVGTVAIQRHGIVDLLALFDEKNIWRAASHGRSQPDTPSASDRIDRIVLHPLIGLLLLATVLFLVFQAVFAWAEWPKAIIEAATTGVAAVADRNLPPGWPRSLLVDGVIAGAGGVLAFLPQIIILHFFILVLEESGYLPRAAFLLDRLMGRVGISGRSFIPLLSCFACAIPGIMAARTIASRRDRMVTILMAPLMTCSARLPVYALLIGAFVPRRTLGGGIELQGLVLFGLYLAGIAGAMGVAWLLKRFTAAGREVRPLMMELPSYRLPTPSNLAVGLWQRAKVFLSRIGGIILILSVLLWFLASFPAAPEGAAGAAGAAIEYSFAGMLGKALAPVFTPIGINWQISVALVPALAAREVVVSALGTVHSLGAGDAAEQALSALIAGRWSLATAFSLLAWFVFAPQCLATLATVRRETGSRSMPLIMAACLSALAWLASFVTYRAALWLGLG